MRNRVYIEVMSKRATKQETELRVSYKATAGEILLFIRALPWPKGRLNNLGTFGNWM